MSLEELVTYICCASDNKVISRIEGEHRFALNNCFRRAEKAVTCLTNSSSCNVQSTKAITTILNCIGKAKVMTQRIQTKIEAAQKRRSPVFSTDFEPLAEGQAKYRNQVHESSYLKTKLRTILCTLRKNRMSDCARPSQDILFPDPGDAEVDSAGEIERRDVADDGGSEGLVS